MTIDEHIERVQRFVAEGWGFVASEHAVALVDEVRRLREALRATLPYLERAAEELPMYGNFPGGDPRHFTPDPEASTEEERAAWKAACDGVRLAPSACRRSEIEGTGVHSRTARKLSQQMPKIGLNGPGYSSISGVCSAALRTEGIYAWFASLQARLRRVRVCCGDWKRIMGPSVIYGSGATGIVLDPPYSHEVRTRDLYAEDRDVSAEVRAWAIEHGDDPRLRIALCGYAGEHEMPTTWECVVWKANGGYGNVSGNRNKHAERIWFSPHCLREQRGQLALLGGAA